MTTTLTTEIQSNSIKKSVISLFSGIDCLGMGFAPYFDIVLAVEKEKNACETLRINRPVFHPHLTVWNADLFELSDEQILAYKGAHGIISGPPCQPFSPAKSQFDPNDARIQGLAEFKRWVHLIQPEFFMFENTDGLLQKSKRLIFDQFIEDLQVLGYNVQFQVLNALDYGSVQKRKRVIAVGFRQDLSVSFEFPVPTGQSKTVADILKDEPLGECLQYSASRREIIEQVPEGGNWRNLPSEEWLKKALGGNYEKREGGMTGVYRRLSRTGHCTTLTTNPCQRNTMMCHPTEHRPLSVKESMRAQGLPDTYQLVGTVSEKYKYIGNGVPVELATAIASSIASAYNQSSDSKKIDESTVLKVEDNQMKEIRTTQLSLF